MKVLRVLVCLVIPLIVMLWTIRGTCAPSGIEPQRLIYKIVSDYSGKYVAVTRGGRVHAHANHATRKSQFYPVFNHKDGTVRFESVKFKDRFLIMDEQKGKIKLGRENDTENNRFILEEIFPFYSAMRVAHNTSCFVAFNEDGQLVDPCTAKLTDPEVRVVFNAHYVTN